MFNKKIAFLFFLIFFTFIIYPAFSSDENRVALVIGNSNYEFFSPLNTPVEEAKSVAETLERLGFDVILSLDANLEEMLDSLYIFEEKLKSGGIAFFHYGGHGVQSNGQNYLIPVNSDISDERKLRTRSLNLSEVMSTLEISGSETNIIVIDACRNNPIPGLERSGKRGLSIAGNQPGNSIIIYSAQAGSTATDGIFTPTLLNYLEQPLGLTEILQNVQRDVQQQTGRNQRPGSYSELITPIYLAGKVDSLPGEQNTVEIIDGFVKSESAWFDFYGPFSKFYRNEFDYADKQNHHKTWLSSFYIDPYETTFEDYDEFCNATGWDLPDDKGWGRGNRPVIHVSFSDVIAYVNWKSKQVGLDPCYSKEGDIVRCDFSKNGYRLPTSAEWEFIARDGGKMIIQPWGNGEPAGNLPDKVYSRVSEYPEYSRPPTPLPDDSELYTYTDGFPFTAPVGSFSPNSFGIYDLEGNVTELCWDIYWAQSDKYRDDNNYYFTKRNPTGPSFEDVGWQWGSTERVRRGNSWRHIFLVNEDYFDGYNAEKIIYNDVGFRLVRTAEE